jgi:hypothetical protein
MVKKRAYRKKADLLRELAIYSAGIDTKISEAKASNSKALGELKVSKKDIEKWISEFEKSHVSFNDAHDEVRFLFQAAGEESI